MRDFPGESVLDNARGIGSIPGPGIRIPFARGN